MRSRLTKCANFGSSLQGVTSNESAKRSLNIQMVTTMAKIRARSLQLKPMAQMEEDVAETVPLVKCTLAAPNLPPTKSKKWKQCSSDWGSVRQWP